VRFLLAPPPEEDTASLHKKPTEHTEEVFKFGSARRWGKDQLDRLGVDFRHADTQRFNLNSIFKGVDGTWTTSHRERNCSSFRRLTITEVEDGVRQLTSVDVRKLASNELNSKTIRKSAPQFEAAFGKIVNLMNVQEFRKSKKREAVRQQASQSQGSFRSTETTKKRPPQSPSQPESSKRTRTEAPDRSTFPIDPKFSTSTDGSGATDELKDEERTKILMNTFLTSSMMVLEDFLQIIWPRCGLPIKLFLSYYFFFRLC